MCEVEFAVTSRVENLFSSTSLRHYAIKETLSKQSVTVEILQLKRSMYDDVEAFIFKQFDVYCNLIRQFSEFDESLKFTAIRVLLQVSEKLVCIFSNVLEDEELDENTCFQYRNMLKMTVFLLCQCTQAFEEAICKRTTIANIGKGRKKKKSEDDSEFSEWPEVRSKFLVIIKKIFQMPIRRFWNPPIIEHELINFVTTCFFKLLENTEVSKDKGIKTEIFRFLGSILIENQTGLAYSIKILQLVQDFEHLSTVLAEAVVHFVQECGADTLISAICREACLLDMKALVQNLSAAHSLSQFLMTITEKCPDRVLCVIGSLLQYLEWESHVMRNCVLCIIGIILNKALTNENLSSKDKKTREDLLKKLMEHLCDVNSFVRCKAIQMLKMLLDEKALASIELHSIGKQVSRRLKDKASNVRKNAMGFLSQFIYVNQFACQIPLPVLRESFRAEAEKLQELKKSRPVIFEDSDDEGENNNVAANGLIFDDSDDEENENDKDKKADKEKKVEMEDGVILQNDLTNKESEQAEDLALKEANEEDEAFKKQENVVTYLKNTLNFAEVIHGVVEPVSALLHSQTQTDVLEAIDFFTSAAGNLVTGSEAGVREILNLVWSNEAPVRDAALDSFRMLYLSTPKEKRDATEIAKKLIVLLKDATADDAMNLQAFVKHFSKLGEIPESVSNVLLTNLINPSIKPTEEEKISMLMLLGMISEECPGFVFRYIDTIVENCLGQEAEENFQLAKYTFQVLFQANSSNRGKFETLRQSDIEIRLPTNHPIVDRFKCLLIEGIKNSKDDHWVPMANEAVGTIFCLMQEPTLLCAEIATSISDIIWLNFQPENDEEVVSHNIPNFLLSRFLSFCGDVALNYVTYLKVDHFAELRREEIDREMRRRKCSAVTPISVPKYSKIGSIPKAKPKKRASIGQSYRLVPPIDEETTYEQILDILSKEVQDETKLIGMLLPIVVSMVKWSLKSHNENVQAASSLALTKFMLISEKVCEDNMQLFATIAEKSPEPYIRANMVIAMGDLATSYPNIVEPWTPQVYSRLKDSDASVREASIITLTHLILHDFVRVKSLISEAAKCIADSQSKVAEVAMYLFSELSKKGNIIYNIIPDIISSLSDSKSGFSEEKFQVVLGHMLQYIEKEKLVEGLVEKLCCRFTDSSTDMQIHELTFCLSILTLNDKCYRKLIEFKTLLKERMSDPIVMKYINNISTNAKKNDAKTAAELETFRKELGI